MSNLSAQLSPTMMHHYFDNNSDKAWNLQYLIWETGVSSYLNLSEENKKFIQELADLILTDEYAENISSFPSVLGGNA